MKTHKQDKYVKEDTRLALLEQSFNHINKTLKEYEKRFDELDKALNKVDNHLWNPFIWMIGGFASILLLIAHVQHWI